MSFGINTNVTGDGDDIARPRFFRKRIDPSSPAVDDGGADGNGEVDAHDNYEPGLDSLSSPRDVASGLPNGQVWDDTDIAHVVGDAPSLIDTSTGEIVWADEASGRQDIEVENDETHVTDRVSGPGHVLGAVQKRLPGSAAVEGFESQTRPHADGFTADADPDAPLGDGVVDVPDQWWVKAMPEVDDGDGLYGSNPGGGLLGATDDSIPTDSMSLNFEE